MPPSPHQVSIQYSSQVSAQSYFHSLGPMHLPPKIFVVSVEAIRELSLYSLPPDLLASSERIEKKGWFGIFETFPGHKAPFPLLCWVLPSQILSLHLTVFNDFRPISSQPRGRPLGPI